MSILELPCTLTLPSGTRVKLRRAEPRAADPGAHWGSPGQGEARFADVLRVLETEVHVEREPGRRGDVLPVASMPLADFHVLRAVLTKAGLVHEDDVAIECHNCGAELRVRPCDALELGPWLDGELDDPELDHLAPAGEPLEIAPIPLGRVRQARTVTFGPLTVGEALPLFAAVARDPLDVDPTFVRAMGLRALGPTTDPDAIAGALSECDNAAFGSVTDAFLETHYSARLASDVICGVCKAKSTTLAPALREFELGPSEPGPPEGDPHGDGDRGASSPLPPLDEFVEIAHALAEPLIAEIPGEKPVLVVDDRTPAVDDGGVPLLGSYVPPPPKDLPVPTRPPTVTVYFRTFAAIEREEGPFDWRGELVETIEHELEHHEYFLRGDDPMDEEEHAEIDLEAIRVVGRGEARRRALVGFGRSIPDFFRRAWPLVLIGAAMLALSLAEGRCAP